MFPNITTVINSIQRGKIKDEDKTFICRAVQEYYKTLNKIGALSKVAPKQVKPKKGKTNA